MQAPAVQPADRTFTSDAELYALLKPYEGLCLNRDRNRPHTTLINIHQRGQAYINADLRRVNEGGIDVLSMIMETVPFSAILRVTIRTCTKHDELARQEWFRAAALAQQVAA